MSPAPNCSQIEVREQGQPFTTKAYRDLLVFNQPLTFFLRARRFILPNELAAAS